MPPILIALDKADGGSCPIDRADLLVPAFVLALLLVGGFALGTWVGGMFTAACCRYLAAKVGGSVVGWPLVGAYGAIANGGHFVEPIIVDRIEGLIASTA